MSKDRACLIVTRRVSDTNRLYRDKRNVKDVEYDGILRLRVFEDRKVRVLYWCDLSGTLLLLKKNKKSRFFKFKLNFKFFNGHFSELEYSDDILRNVRYTV